MTFQKLDLVFKNKKKNSVPRVSLSTDDRQNALLHCSEKSATFSSEEEAASLNNAMGKNIIILSRGNVICNLV